MNEYALMKYYVKYLKEIRKVSDSTVKHYQDALRRILKHLVQKGKVQQIAVMDTEVAVSQRQTSSIEVWKRSTIIKIQSIKSAGYQCEMNPGHSTFTAKSTGHPYMEGHHALPMKHQDKFTKSLDVYANIVCLCPICHRLLHYGIEPEKENVLNKIYYDRSDRLAASGIRISKTEFIKLVV